MASLEPFMQVGMDVYYYHAGDTTKPPFPAKIMAVNGAGALDLLVFSLTNGLWQRTNVYHKDSPEFTKRPMIRASQGCWEHVPYMAKPERPPAPVKADDKAEAKKKAS